MIHLATEKKTHKKTKNKTNKKNTFGIIIMSVTRFQNNEKRMEKKLT